MSRVRDRYLTTAGYAPSWGSNSDSLSKSYGAEPDEAMRHATTLVDEMRRDGASSPIRTVTVRDWPNGSSLKDARLLYEASYYDAAQGLSDTDKYAARVHDWHECVDRMDANQARNNSKWRTGYSAWSDDWGPRPTECPACNASLRLGKSV
jgi:hypothetical protein